ncbi:hypothetical protein TWF696_003931 [Orbilia brochopaga]|uniref:Annexin n=1 Tax=Orbilia brochopaga TaxID=3140254 RepID=A0AAV9V4X2_9PEZI
MSDPYGQQQPPPQGQQQWGQPQQQQWGQPQQQWGQQPQQWGQPQGQYQQYPPPGPSQGAPQGAPPQQGDQQRGYPQQPQQQWGGPPPPQGYQQQWGAPQGYPPQQQQWGGPQQSYPPQQQQQWGAPPPQNYQQPQGYQQGPPPQQPWGAPAPPQPGYQQPPQQAWGSTSAAGPAGQPSIGFIAGQRAPGYDPTSDVEIIRKACKGFNTDEKALIATLVKLNPLQIESINQKYMQDTRKSLVSLLEDKTRGSLEDGLCALARGPLNFYVFLVERATKGLGTKEFYLDLALLGRSNADMNALKTAFKAKFGRTLESTVADDLSGCEKRMFEMVTSATRTEDSAGVNPQHVTAEVKSLHAATEGRIGTDETEVSRIFIKNNDATLAAIAKEYERTYHMPVETLIKKEFSGHQEDALLYMLRGVLDKAKRDAELIEGTMKGLGTKDEQLAFRLVAAHWIPGAIPAIKVAYQKLYGKDLVSRVRGETSGDFERLLVAILNK